MLHHWWTLLSIAALATIQSLTAWPHPQCWQVRLHTSNRGARCPSCASSSNLSWSARRRFSLDSRQTSRIDLGSTLCCHHWSSQALCLSHYRHYAAHTAASLCLDGSNFAANLSRSWSRPNLAFSSLGLFYRITWYTWRPRGHQFASRVQCRLCQKYLCRSGCFSCIGTWCDAGCWRWLCQTRQDCWSSSSSMMTSDDWL